MKRKYIYRLMLAGIFIFYLLNSPLSVSGQGGEWKVWVKAAPCSGRFDWITVAKENPTGGGNFFYLANFIFPGTTCTNFGCTFSAATAVANSLRTSSEFFKYCCRDYSVWENLQTGKRSVVVGKFGTAGLGWVIVKADLCCEEAEALAGITGACSGAASNQQTVNNTNCWPGSYAAWNEQAKRVECYCKPGLVWNSTKTACVDPKELVNNADCSMYAGSIAAWNEQLQRVECYCPEGKTWNSTKTACIDNAAAVNCWPGSYAAYNPQTKRTECFCNPGLVWNSTKTACVDPQELVRAADCSMYSGSYAAWNDKEKRVECYCPEGKTWNSARTACIDKVAQTNCWPGSYAAYNPQTNRTECFCNPGLVWNSTKTACVDPQELVRATDCSMYGGSYAAWNEQAQRVECYCPTGKTWNSTRTACVDIAGNNTGAGSGNWVLVSATAYPEKRSNWSYNPQSGTSHMVVYTGDIADFQWTPPPQQFGSSGFTMTLSVQSKPLPNSRLAATIGVGTSGLNSNNPNKQSAYANAPAEKASDQTSITFTPSGNSDVEVRVEMMWGDVKIIYKYKKM
ncbi:MAG: hypothetical protein KAY50_04820 [Chitinophagaceae bacterium]|nr:hypothetical protein [Chitinophagaceae bacterium]